MYQLLTILLWIIVTIQSKHYIIETKKTTDELLVENGNPQKENEDLNNVEVSAKENLEPESEFNAAGISDIDNKKGSKTKDKRAELLKIIDENFGESEVVTKDKDKRAELLKIIDGNFGESEVVPDIENDPVTEEIGAALPKIDTDGFEEGEDPVNVAVRPGRAGGGRAVFGGGSNCRNKKNRNQCKSKTDGTVCRRREGKKYAGEGVCCDSCCRSTMKDILGLLKHRVVSTSFLCGNNQSFKVCGQ